MPELIERHALLKKVYEHTQERERMTDGEWCRKCIYEAPKVESEPVRKPKMSDADRKECEEWCKDCEHIEMCAWYPFGGCDFRLLPKPEQPTIEPEVRHGEWHECWYTDTVCASICTNCGKAATQARHIVGQELMTNVRYPLCPNCGARMDGGADNG